MANKLEEEILLERINSNKDVEKAEDEGCSSSRRADRSHNGRKLSEQQQILVSKLQDAIKNCQLDEINEVLNNPDFVSIDFVDEDNKNCLELALNMGYTEVVEMLLDLNDDDWKGLLRRRHDHNSDNSPIQVMIKKMPEMAYYVFNKCVNHKEDNIIAYEYEFLDDTYIIPEEKVNELGTNAPYIKGDESGKLRDEAQQRSKDFKTIIKTHPLNLMVREKHFDLLAHPLVQSYLIRRWNYTKCFYYTACLIYLNLAIFLTIVVDTLPPIYSKENGTVVILNVFYDQVGCILPKSPYYILLYVYIISIQLLLIIIKLTRYDPLSVILIIEYFSAIAVCILVFPFAFCEFFSGNIQWNLLVVANFIAWINFLNYIKRVPRFGVYVLLVWKIIQTFLRILPIFVLLLLPFSVTFFVLLGDVPGLLNFLRRFLHTLVFLTGEFNFDNNIASNHFPLTYIVFTIYLFVGCIFIMNLLIGLTVSDTLESMKQAVNTRISLQIEIIFHVESGLPQRTRRCMARGNENVRKDTQLCNIFKKITRSFGLPKKLLYEQQTRNESDVKSRQLIKELQLLNKQLNEQKQQINDIRQAIKNIPSATMKLISDAQSD